MRPLLMLMMAMLMLQSYSTFAPVALPPSTSPSLHRLTAVVAAAVN